MNTEAGSDKSPISHDRRWVRIRRPTVIVGGEMTMDSLEIRHDPQFHVSEAPLQLKSNCGCLLIDDFGRQRIEPNELLNRWIIPLECRHDFLTLANGKKIKVPFEQLIIFSTNLEPSELADEAFSAADSLQDPRGRPERGRIPSLVPCTTPPRSRSSTAARRSNICWPTHYRGGSRPMRRCHPARSVEPTAQLLRLPRGSAWK